MTGKLLLRSRVPLNTPTELGGAGRLMAKIAAALSQEGWDIHILSPKAEREEEGLDINYHYFDYKSPDSPYIRLVNSVRGAGTFRNLARTTNFDVILDDVSHIPFYPAHFYCPEETQNALFLHTAFFNQAHVFNGYLKGTITNIIDRTLPYLNSPTIICAGPSTQDRVETITEYTDTAVLRPCVDITGLEYDYRPESKTILYLGRHTKRKNVSCLLEAWKGVENRFPEFQLQIAGKGNRTAYLKKKAEPLNQVTFLGYVEEKKKNELLQESLAMVIPSLMEGYVTTGIEGMAAGSLVIGADVPGINDYVSHRETGLLFPRDDSSALTRQLEAVLSNPHTYQEIVSEARRLAEDHSFEKFTFRADKQINTLLGT